jgi:hypothetical protein
MFFYQWEELIRDACDGNLFVCHIVREAKPVFDPLKQLEQLRNAFQLRTSYAHEIAQASDLGWLLDRHAAALSPGVVVRRLVWCVRTILIARRAERGAPVFATAELAAGAGEAVSELLAHRHQRRLDISMRQRFKHFLAKEGCSPPLATEATVEDYRALFTRTGNKVGLQTIERGIRPADDEDYYR